MIIKKLSCISQANFARWEPWHGKFRLSYPWKKYLKIGEVLRDMAANVLSVKGCLQSPRQVLLLLLLLFVRLGTA